MARQKKDYKLLNVKLDSAVYAKLDEYIEETGLTKTAALERILNVYLDGWHDKVKKGRKDIL